MAWLCVDKNGEHIFSEEPIRGCTQKSVPFYRERLLERQSKELWYAYANDIDDHGFIEYDEEGIDLPQGSIKKLIGRELSFDDKPVEL